MGAIDGRTWLEHMSPAECWRLLASTPVGRIGVLNDSAPEIYPVNHVVDRRAPGSACDGSGSVRYSPMARYPEQRILSQLMRPL